MLGNNQTGVRVHNEKLVLSLLRRGGPLARAEIARATGLSAQAVSVIMGALEADGMLLRGQPVRGKVGQPSVPMRLAPDGAFFFGVMVGRRVVDVVLADMLGEIRFRRQTSHGYPDYDQALKAVADSVRDILGECTSAQRDRIAGVGLAMPGVIWSWSDTLGVSTEDLIDWRDRSFQYDLSKEIALEVEMRNDGSAACGAELVFGRSEAVSDAMLYFYVAYFIGGGIVLDGRVFTGPSGSAGALGPMVLPQPDGAAPQLLDVASLVQLTDMVRETGKRPDSVWEMPLDWSHIEAEVDAWIERIAPPIAQAITVSCGVIDFERVMIDGFMPPWARTRLLDAVSRALEAHPMVGLIRPELLEGTMGPDARVLGAAALPLARRFLV